MTSNYCIYSGCSQGGSLTITYVDQIVREIAKQEGRDLSQYSIYDLQTAAGYPKFSPDQFEFDRIVFSVDGHMERRVATECPEQILTLFRIVAPYAARQGKTMGLAQFPYHF